MKEIFRKIVVAIITWEARLILAKYKPQIIAVTGSVGKTSTKDAIYTALEDSLYIRKNVKSFNSEIGIPLTILGCDSGWNNPFRWLGIIFEGLALILLANHYPKWLVLEVGTDRPGDIQEIAKWLKPDVVVVTSLPDIPVHVENFAGPRDVIREKKTLIKALKKDGTLVLSGDDKETLLLKKEFSDRHILLFGVEPHNDVSASHTSFLYNKEGRPIGMSLRVEEEGSSIPIQICERLGQQQIYPILCAFAVAQALGMGPLAIAKALKKEKGPKGRMKILRGFNESSIIDDSYNSSPTALRAAITTLKKVESKGKKLRFLVTCSSLVALVHRHTRKQECKLLEWQTHSLLSECAQRK
ncbi:MAG: hypothetical protein JKX80_01675 [Candidatus Pacebacteria bacterium]|nr:hypothetical protein [Candidatus Paceibacterota bacterium]